MEDVGVGDIYLMRIGGRKPKHASILVSDETDLPKGKVPEIVHAYALGGKGKVVKEPLVQWMPHLVRGFRFKNLVH